MEKCMGAEAEILSADYLGLEAVMKVRPPKTYRHPVLDERLRSSRTKNEVRVMRDARNAGVRTPVIYDVDLKDCAITMEFIRGEKVKDVLDTRPQDADRVCAKIGTAVAKLHDAGICHGDLTTSNMILTPDGELCIFDFSLGGTVAELEDKGVDMHLLERGFMSAHSGLEHAYAGLVDSYMSASSDGTAVMERVEDIKSRARYT
jgi:TP53 regulating kinase and related kinases